MALKAKVLGREALTKRLAQLAPNAEKYAADAKIKAMTEFAESMEGKAPTGATLEYMHSFEADFLRNRPAQEMVGIKASKDPDATGLYAEFIWRFLEFGTAPHSTAKGGGTVAGKKAAAANPKGMHPGTTAQPHIFPAWRAFKPKAKKLIAAAINKAVREAKK
ncbi:HK97 gp10 family phage protein [Pararhizobium sp. O133]|uniref:HK97 gp10 family phage protein n=1 Tax=Pararhizobium sp. O133 TaxID=3449278 RepID=UPI003F684560